LADVEEETFLANEVLQSAVLQKLAVIGEAAARVSQELRDEHDDVEWRTITGLRNIVVHEYFAISWETTWVTAQRDVPDLAGRARSERATPRSVSRFGRWAVRPAPTQVATRGDAVTRYSPVASGC
jgi:uncharacterized protein with HEPN domain